MNLHKSLKKYSDQFTSTFSTSASDGSYTQFTHEVVVHLHTQNSNFKYCQFDKELGVNTSGSGDFRFENCVFKGDVVLTQITHSIIFKNCIFEEKFIFNSHQHHPLLSFQQCNMNCLESRAKDGQFSISSSEIGTIIFPETSIHKLEIIDSIISSEIKGLAINNLYVNKDSSLDNIISDSILRISFDNISFLRLETKQVNDCTMKFVKGNSFSIQSISNVTILDSDIEAMHFLDGQLKHFKIENCTSGEILIYNSKFIDSNSQFTLKHLLVSGLLEISKSNLKNAFFESLIVRSATVSFHDSNYKDWDFNKIDWPTGHDIDLGYTGLLSENLVHRDFYRELKRKCIESENMIDAAYFRSKELAFHSKYISELSKEFIRVQGLFKFFKNDLFSEWFILWTNRIFSGFGGNVWRPLLLGLFLHLIFFNLFLLGFSGFDIRPFYFGLPEVEMESTIKGIVKYLEMFNPLHSFADNVNLAIGALFMDIVMRVSSGYFIFYILRASRKFSK